MLRIQKLVHPVKGSGTLLGPNKSIKMKGVRVTNLNKFDVHVAPHVRKRAKK